jgi:hypothetical protein
VSRADVAPIVRALFLHQNFLGLTVLFSVRELTTVAVIVRVTKALTVRAHAVARAVDAVAQAPREDGTTRAVEARVAKARAVVAKAMSRAVVWADERILARAAHPV